ncbi:MAG: FkbM family methyltransferase [Verrucomicrobia bacterium]|nr:FkbM family methyltransferase [Verrucomicrobiota bacterium]
MLDFTELLRSWNKVSPEVRRLIDAFASPEGARQRYLLGRNEHSAALSKVFEVDGFVDDFAEPGTVWNGKPVVRTTDVPSHAIVVNCSMCISPVSVAKRLAGMNIDGVVAFCDLCRALPSRVQLPDFVLQTRQDIKLNQAKWEHVAKSLNDAQSRQVLDDLLRYRTTGDYSTMNAYSVRLRDQYFEDFLGFVSDEVFVDAGGFDGDTTEEFCRRCPTYRKVYLFEPSVSNIQKARARLRGMRSIEFIERGLSDVVGTLSFNPEAGSASAVRESGVCQIPATTLDNQVHEKVSFIKMDLEGWELKALAGSRRHICEDRPKLAIAVYHEPSHFWRVFDFVMALRSDYKVHLRHYTEGWSETVMYFSSDAK